MRYVIAYAATAVIYFGLDFLWLSQALGLYRERIGGLLLDQPNLPVAALFYLIYVGAIVVLVINPAVSNGGTWWSVLLTGAILGLAAYGTYDITNLSTLKGWSLSLTFIDLAWGTSVSAVASLGGFLVTKWLAPG